MKSSGKKEVEMKPSSFPRVKKKKIVQRIKITSLVEGPDLDSRKDKGQVLP